MNWWLLVVGWLVGYGAVYLYLTVISPSPSLRASGPILMWRSRVGLGVVERLASATRFWRSWGVVGLACALVGLVISMVFVAGGLFALVTQGASSSAIDSPTQVLVIPGVNEFLPLAAAPEIVLGLILGMVVHEGGHAIMCYLADIEVESTGLLFFLGVPLGAFVEPDEESQKRSPRVARLQMFAAGIMNNLVFAVVALALLFGPIAGAIAVAPGAPVGGVVPGSPVDDAGIEAGDRITAVEGVAIEEAAEVEERLQESERRRVAVTVDGTEEVEVVQGVSISTVAADAPDAFETGAAVTAVNGVEVWSEEQFYAELRSGETADLTIDGEHEVSVDAGVDAVVQSGSALADVGAPTGETVTITHVEGTPVYTGSGVAAQLEAASGAQEQTVTLVAGGVAEEYTVSVDTGELYGVEVGSGEAGFEVTDFGAEYYPADNYLAIISGGGDAMPLWQSLVSLLLLPLASIGPGITFDFPGFTPFVQNFYTVTGAAGSIAGAWFFAASVLYWGAWININLALFNCLPTYTLDGGHILRDTVDSVLDWTSRWEPGGELAETVKGSVLTGTLLVLLGLILSPLLL